MISDSLDIIYNMEQSADTLGILNGKIGLTDFNKIICYGMIKIIDILLNGIYLCDIFLIKRNQTVHASVQILSCKNSHTFKLSGNFNNSSRR